jgi:hypothetical protein
MRSRCALRRAGHTSHAAAMFQPAPLSSLPSPLGQPPVTPLASLLACNNPEQLPARPSSRSRLRPLSGSAGAWPCLSRLDTSMQPAVQWLALAGLLLVSGAASLLSDFAPATAVAYGGPTDGKDPHMATGGLLEGSCGERGWAAAGDAAFERAPGLQAPHLPHNTNSPCPLNSADYGLMDQATWPYSSAVAVGSTHPLAANSTRRGCGSCIEIQCDPRPGYEASVLLLSACGSALSLPWCSLCSS